MKKLASTLPNMLLSLGTITVAAGALLGWVYTVTKEPIAQQAMQQQVEAISAVAPKFDNNPETDRWETEVNGVPVTVYPAMMGDRLVGAAVKAASFNGFAGEIIVMCGFDADGTVRDYQVLSQAETPGLGSKMQEWFRDPTGARSVIGKNPATTSFYVSKDTGGEIDAITAATISSRAFLEILRTAFESYRQYASTHGVNMTTASGSDANSGASSQHKETKEVSETENSEKVSDANSGASQRHDDKDKHEKHHEKNKEHKKKDKIRHREFSHKENR